MLNILGKSLKIFSKDLECENASLWALPFRRDPGENHGKM
jgi:hypothetical protein